jgi:hypothetical protein
MALDVKVGTFPSGTSTSTVSVTGVGFRPKALFVFGNELATGTEADALLTMGVAVSRWESHQVGGLTPDPSVVENQSCVSMFSIDDEGTSDTRRGVDDAKIIRTGLKPVANRETATLNSFDANGFTVQFTVASSGAETYHYLALGGDDITGTHLEDMASLTSTGSVTVETGFRPSCLLAIGASKPSDGFANTSNSSIGFATGTSTDQNMVASVYSRNAQGTSSTSKYMRTSHLAALVNASNDYELGELSNLNEGGYSVNWSTAYGTAYLWPILAIGGISCKIITGTAPASTGSSSYTGAGFRPEAALFLSTGKTSGTGISSSNQICIGAATGPSERFCIGIRDTSGAGTTEADKSAAADQVLTSTAISYEADLTSFDVDGFTLDWSAVSGSEEEFTTLLIGSAATPVEGGQWAKQDSAGARSRYMPGKMRTSANLRGP